MTFPPQDPYNPEPPRNSGTPPPWGQWPQGPGGPPQGSGGHPRGPAGPSLGTDPFYGQPHQQWPGGPPPVRRHKGAGKGKWIFGSLALVAVIALSVTTTLLVTRSDDSSEGTPHEGTAGNSEYASANDTAPANIVTDDPTCEAWGRISRAYVDKAKAVGWDERDSSIPATRWSPEQRSMYETVGEALDAAAAPAKSLAEQTPHRVIRELLEQFVAYARTFVDAIPTYEPPTDAVQSTALSAMSAMSNICGAIDYKSIQSVAPLVSDTDGPSNPQPPTNDPQRLLTTGNPVCTEWIEKGDQLRQATEAWGAIPAKIPAKEWTAEQKAIYDAATPTFTAYADTVETLGRDSDNSALEDFAVLAAQYLRAYTVAVPEYTAADNYISQAGIYLANTVYFACKAAQ